MQIVKAKTVALPKFMTYYMLVFRTGYKWQCADHMYLTAERASQDREHIFLYPNVRDNDCRVVEIKLPE